MIRSLLPVLLDWLNALHMWYIQSGHVCAVFAAMAGDIEQKNDWHGLAYSCNTRYEVRRLHASHEPPVQKVN